MAVQFNIKIDQGADKILNFFIEVLTNPDLPYDVCTNPYVPLDLTSYTAVLEVSSDFGEPPVLTLSSTGTNPALQLEGSTGEIIATFSSSSTSAIPLTEGCWEGIYQMELYSGTLVKRPVQGEFIISRELITN